MNSTFLKKTDRAAVKYFFPIIILTGFAFYFAYDIYTLKKCLTNVDIYTWYYPYRQWFSQRLLNGEFPLWNPYTGIGLPAELCATIPLDIYSAIEMVFGPQYHYFQLVQLIVLLAVGFYVFVRLGFTPLTATAGILLFFETGWYLGNVYSASNSVHKYNRKLKKSFRTQVQDRLKLNLGVPEVGPLGLSLSYKF